MREERANNFDWVFTAQRPCSVALPIRFVVLVRLIVLRRLRVLKVETDVGPSGQPLAVRSSITSGELLTRANVRQVLPS